MSKQELIRNIALLEHRMKGERPSFETLIACDMEALKVYYEILLGRVC